LDLPLQIGNVEQSVNVNAATPLLQASRGTELYRRTAKGRHAAASTGGISFL
jgi:hypothetical protein